METIIIKDNLEEYDKRKLFNIKAFNSLDRKNLAFDEIQRKLLLKEFPSGEKLYIRYPGKESTPKRGAKKPNDFYPELVLNDGTIIKPDSFKNVWDGIYLLNNNGIDMYALATIFVRMAYMIDSKKVKNIFTYYDTSNGKDIAKNTLELEYYEYSPNKELFDELGIPIDTNINKANIVAYLTYNDLIAQNEDCKYWYIANEINHTKWKRDVGRINTCLTHVSVIAYISQLCTFPEIAYRFIKSSGVAPIPKKYFREITQGRICINKK